MKISFVKISFDTILWAVFAPIFFGVVVGFSFLFYDTSFSGFSFGFLIGLYLGFAALPSVDADFKPHPKICALIGGALGAFIATESNLQPSIFAVCVFGFLVTGYLAPKWAPHILDGI